MPCTPRPTPPPQAERHSNMTDPRTVRNQKGQQPWQLGSNGLQDNTQVLHPSIPLQVSARACRCMCVNECVRL